MYVCTSNHISQGTRLAYTACACTLYKWLCFCVLYFTGFPGGSVVKNPPANAGDVGSIPGLGRSSGERNGTPLQYSCLQNAMGRGGWRATVPGVTESDTTEQLNMQAGCAYRIQYFYFLPVHLMPAPACQLLHCTPVLSKVL